MHVLGPVCLIAALLHPNSISFSKLEVTDSRATLTTRCQVLSLLEVIDADTNGDGFLENREIDSHRDAITEYFADHYRLSSGGRRLVGVLSTAERVAPEPSMPVFGSTADEWVHLVFDYVAVEAIDGVDFEVSLFLTTSPDHSEHCILDWNGRQSSAPTFDAGSRTWTFDPYEGAPRHGFVDWVELGIEHILTGWDHLAFLVALIVAARSVRGVLWVVTAFTVAHSITLGLTALGLGPRLPDRVVELSIALSIVYVAVDNLLRRASRDSWGEAAFFGLIHGFGFAGFLSESLFLTRQKSLALLGFNIGVEVGQIGVALIVLALLRVPFLRPQEDAQGLTGARVRQVTSIVIAGAGAYWFVERGWFGG